MDAAESSVARCKLSVIAQATADLQECVDPEVLKPYKEHFHPELVYGTGPNANANVRGRYLEPRKLGTPHTAITVLPLKRQVKSLEFVSNTMSDKQPLAHRTGRT